MSDDYTDRMRALQDRFGTRALADRLVTRTWRREFTDADREFLLSRLFLFLATADADGADCSYKGLMPGHLAITGPASLSFPSIDGNGMYRSLGNILANPGVGLLFIDFDRPRRLRVNGKARIDLDDPRIAEIPGAEAMVHVEATQIFPNCPRYIQSGAAQSEYFETEDAPGKTPDWKRSPDFADVLPEDET